MAKRATVVKNKKKKTAALSPRQRRSLVSFFAESPLAKVRIHLMRKPDYSRKVDL